MRSSVPVIVNFHADWCEPCHNLKPLLQKISKDNPGKIHVAEVSLNFFQIVFFSSFLYCSFSFFFVEIMRFS
ncbi:UNVERIFIED_CONTAM: hypothetical protein GTU68_054196 [Idotea baltica]|nr:hypothetical protein [Idotea baltica]